MNTELYVVISKSKSGQFAGKIYQETEEICGIAGCKNELEVLEKAQELYDFDIPFVIDNHSGASKTNLISQQKQKYGD
jgi:hypothetical protein